ncbi:MAG TPA: amidohydrolase [Kofleriaceae bacterium]|nr:amidohydrolase [Kofleriaceae bacterium]
MLDLLILNAEVLSTAPGAASVRPRHDIAILGNRIDAILPTGQIDPGRARDVIDARDMIAMPGLINAHCHTAMVLFRGVGEDVSVERWFNDVVWPLEMNLTPEDVYWGALLGLAEMIEAGVTTVADHYFHMDEVARATEQAGTRANLCWAVFGLGARAPEAKLHETIEWALRWQGGASGRITAWLGPHAPFTCGEEFLRKVADRAKQLGVGAHIHVSETREQVRSSLERTGKTPIEVVRDAGLFEVPTILAHAAHPTDGDIQIMARAGAGVAHCPKTFLKLAAGIAPVLKLREAGIPVGIGSDGAVSNNTLDILEQTRLAAMLQKHEHQRAEVLPIAEALTMACHDGARVLRLDSDLGDLAPGKLADLILIRTDSPHMQPMLNVTANVLYSAQAADVDTVICDGKLLMRGRKLLTLDKAAILSEVRSRLGRLLQRTPGQRLQTYSP